MRNPITGFKILLASFNLVRDTKRLDEVIKIADSLAEPAMMREMLDALGQDPQAALAFERRPRVDLDLTKLARLPGGSLGREFLAHVRRANIDPADLPQRPAHDAESFLRAHLFETHDIWHVVTGFDVDEAGELGLQAFYLAQMPTRLSPFLLGLGMINTTFFAFHQYDARMHEITRGWQLGRRARKLFGTDWNALWSTPLEDVQARFDLAGAVTRVAA
jgi:ubiquinone biosynthesis protein COQ4